MLGGAKNTKTMYISILDNDGKELVRYANTEFDGTPKMFTYVADLRQHLGKTLTIKIVDEQTTDGELCCLIISVLTIQQLI